MLDLIIKRCTLPDGRQDIDIGIAQGRIAALEPALKAEAARTIDAAGQLVSSPFVDAHFHMDSTLSFGLPRVNQSGTLLEGIALWGELAAADAGSAGRARAGLLRLGRGARPAGDPFACGRVRSAPAGGRGAAARARAGQALPGPAAGRLPAGRRAARPGAMDNLKRALDMGVDVVGGIPHFERTMQDGAESVRLLCELAAERGLRVDMHCDESDDPLSRHIETLAYHAQRLGLQGRVTGSHLTSMHSMDNYYVSKLIPLMREAGVSAIANPLINITLQGRHDSYPKRRGMTRVPELLAAGVPVAFGHDCVMDPWYSLGSGDMLEVAHMGLHVAQMTGQDAMRACFEAVTTTPARILGLDDTGLAVGKRADLVLLQARDAVEALRLRATRLMVLRGGEVIAETPPATATLHLPGRPAQVSFQTPAR